MTAALRHDLLAGRVVALAGGGAPAIRAALSGLGARVETLPELDGETVGDWARAHAPIDALVYCAAGPFSAGGLDAALTQAWIAVREVAAGLLIPEGRTGKIVTVGPAPGAGRLAEAARSGLENLARTLSVEWARYGLTTAMLAPGPSATDEQVAQVVCYLVSPAGDYFSGCRFEVGLI